MSTNALAVISGNGSLAKLSEADLIFVEDGLNFDDSFTFIPTQFTVAPGGGKSFVDKNGEMVAAPLTGIVFDSVKTRGYWPNPNNKIPFCSSVGGVHGVVNMAFTDEDFKGATKARIPHPAILAYDKNEAIPDHIPCATCPMNQWGSKHQDGKSAKGKACDEKRRLLFLPDGWHMPIILNLSTMSVNGWDAYCSTLRSKFNLPFYAVKVVLKIEKMENADGKPYGQVSPSMAERVTDPAIARAIVETQKQFRDLLRTMKVEADFDERPAQEGDFRQVDPTTGEIIDAAADALPPF